MNVVGSEILHIFVLDHVPSTDYSMQQRGMRKGGRSENADRAAIPLVIWIVMCHSVRGL